jgi:hypothetical protein
MRNLLKRNKTPRGKSEENMAENFQFFLTLKNEKGVLS